MRLKAAEGILSRFQAQGPGRSKKAISYPLALPWLATASILAAMT